MKETGVIRRIDELGRIVIPKEIRKKMKIRNGDSIDIFIDNEKVVLQKYSPLKDLETISEVLLDSIKKIYNTKVIITDVTKVISTNIHDEIDTTLSLEYIKLIEKKNVIDINHSINLTEKYVISSSSKVKPIIIYGDLIGSIIVLECNVKTDDLLNLIHSFISNYLES